jgi:NADPH:quinone reductase-like Zn-dependent oxidoreductase
MKVIELTAARMNAFRAASRPDAKPGPGEALIAVKAASLNFLDIAVATGAYPLSSFPIVPVTDGAGEIVMLGSSVAGQEEWKLGDRVIPHFLPYWQDGRLPVIGGGPRRGIDLQGSLAEYVVVPQAGIVRTPAHLTDVQAATLPIAATTAWHTIRVAQLGPQKTALLLGTGGVSIFALQFAKAHGARVVITTSSEEKAERCRALGADEVINYKQHPDWASEVLHLTDGKGADFILETGGKQTMPQSIRAAATDSSILVIGFLSGTEASVDVLQIMEKRIRLQGNTTGPVSALRDVCASIANHNIAPVIDQVFGWDNASEAFQHIAAGGHFGKVAIEIAK